jgi:hypothetical protein
MYKVVTFLKRKPGLSLEEFITQYEATHAPIGERATGQWATRYVRRYLRPISHPLKGGEEPPEPEFDVIMELWFENREGFESSTGSVTPEMRAEMIEDAERMIDRSKSVMFEVEERESVLEGSAAS